MQRSVLVDRAAEILGVSRRTVYYRIREGRLQTMRTRCGSQRVLMESIEALLRERTLRATGRPAHVSDTDLPRDPRSLSDATTGSSDLRRRIQCAADPPTIG
jgi:excisionase family DNA binding protein